ncbi:MAG: hypothetical protein AAFU70_14665, partial [Planctomycetota bacterium]
HDIVSAVRPDIGVRSRLGRHGGGVVGGGGVDGVGGVVGGGGDDGAEGVAVEAERRRISVQRRRGLVRIPPIDSRDDSAPIRRHVLFD